VSLSIRVARQTEGPSIWGIASKGRGRRKRKKGSGSPSLIIGGGVVIKGKDSPQCGETRIVVPRERLWRLGKGTKR